MAESKLRAASDTFLASLDRLFELEAEKRQLRLDDPRLLDLSNEIQGLAAKVLDVANIERDLAETAMTDDPVSGPIEASHRSPHEILEEWRAAERALVEAEPGSVEAADALARSQDLRAEYQRAYQDVRREDRAN